MTFVQVTYPLLLVWAIFTHLKIVYLEESLSQVKENTDKNEHLLHSDISLEHSGFIEKDNIIAKVSEDMSHEEINVVLDTEADKEATTLFEGSVIKSKKTEYSSSNNNVDKYHGEHQRRVGVSRNVDRKQRKHFRDLANLKTERSDLSYDRKLSNRNNTSYNTTTTCVLLNDLDSINFKQHELNNSITTFNFTLDLMTDDHPEDTSWKLVPQNRNATIIDSTNENITSSELMDSTLHEFEYRCVVSGEETNEMEDIQLENICYNFELHDSYGDGICCEYGLGYFSLSLNNRTTPVIVDRLYTNSLTSSFCLGKNISSKNKLDISSKYLFRECMNRPCICDSKPRLSNIRDDDVMYGTKVLTLNAIMMMSDSKALADYESPQYKAACWVLHDDAFFYDDNLEIEKRQERMIQRYLLALLYFTLTPERWDNHYHFLSSRSECDWNDDGKGIFCDEDSSAFAINLVFNNLEGTIADELVELRTLEELYLSSNNIHGTIPSMLGRLSELRYLDLSGNYLEGTIFETIGNLQKLSRLNLESNNLSGSIPEALYILKNLKELELIDNELSSSISMLVGNMTKLEVLWLEDNMLTGQIPSTIGNLSSLIELDLNNNMLSGPIPSTIGNMTSLERLSLNNNTLSGSLPESLFDLYSFEILLIHENSVTGSIPDDFCERVHENDIFSIGADCRNDVFDPEVSCSCCTCKDESPVWDGECADATIKVVIDHGDLLNSDSLEWSLTDSTTEKSILNHKYAYGGKGLQLYKACVAYWDCFSFNQISPPYHNTNYHIYWNNKSIYDGTFLGFQDSDDINRDDPPQTLLSFQYDSMNKEIEYNYVSCNKVQYKCGMYNDPIDLEPNTTQYAMYRQAAIVSGTDLVKDPFSPQSRALCWLLQDFNSFYILDEKFETKFTQKYVLTLLHLSSSYSIFGSDEYPPSSHECQWQGVMCTNKVDSDVVTEISLKNNQTINGTLLKELGKLSFLEKLDLRHSEVNGTIPRVYSNLWSLKELDLSGNKIGGTLPETLFYQLNKLEYINLSDNLLSGSINEDIGRYSHLRSLWLSKNLLTGLVPLDSFDEFHLEYFNISENQLSNLNFSLLSKHRNLKTIDISGNFFKGSLEEDLFELLAELEHFNISQNAFTGMIPTTIYEASNITHFDLHANRLKGVIPNGISFLSNLQYLNLQGNELTGSLPSQMNSLKKLETLVLSHNKLKGSIPLSLEELPNMQRLHLHANNFVGKAPDSIIQLKSYYTDCGHPSTSLDPVVCPSCNKCCNADGLCQEKSMKEISQITATLIFLFVLIGMISLLYILKEKITSSRLLQNFFINTVNEWNASTLLSDKSVYHFLLAQNKTEWRIAFACATFQADIANEASDKQYTFTCPSNTLECEDSRNTTGYGLFIFSVILVIWLLRDIIDSVKLMLLSFQKKSIDYFFASGIVFTVTMLSLWTSIVYIIAIATKNTELIKDAVVLLFVIEVDERLFQLVQSINRAWVVSIESSLRGSLVLNVDDLVISSFFKKSNERYESVKRNIHERYGSLRNSSRGAAESEIEVQRKPHNVADE